MQGHHHTNVFTRKDNVDFTEDEHSKTGHKEIKLPNRNIIGLSGV